MRNPSKSQHKARTASGISTGKANPPVAPRTRQRPTHRPRKVSFRLLFISLFGFMIIAIGILVGIGVGMFNQYLDQLPRISYLENYNPWIPSRLFSGDETSRLIADFFNEKQNRKHVPLTEIPQDLIHAVLALEDYEFYDHPGISVKGIVRAAYLDLKNWNRKYGGSTLTIQLAEDLIKNGYLDDYDFPAMKLKSFEQKIWEVILALKIEKRFTKDEILEIYLNQVFMGGNNISGIARAAEFYFGKDVSDLNLKECALFAGMLQRPNAYRPTRHPEAAQKRTDLVLRVMLRRKLITEEQYQKATREPFQLNSKNTRRTQIALYPYFSEDVRRRFIDKQYKTANNVPITIYGQGIDIESTMRIPLQQAAEDSLRQGIVNVEQVRHWKGGHDWGQPSYQGVNMQGLGRLKAGEEYDAKLLEDYSPQKGKIKVTLPNVHKGEGPFEVQINPDTTWFDEFDILKKGFFVRVQAHSTSQGIQLQWAKEPHVQGGLIAVRPSTGEVLAQAGGYQFSNEKDQYIRTVQATMIQPGSAFKPLLYATVLSDPNKTSTITSIIQDVEKEYFTGWTPRNFENRYFGPVTMIYALTHSLNAASVWLLDNYQGTRTAGIRHFRDFCRFAFNTTVEEHNLTIALGSSGTTPWELAQAYSVFANQGRYVPLHLVNKVYQRISGQQKYRNLLYEFQPYQGRNRNEQRLTPQVAYLVTTMLRKVIEEGTGKPAKELPFFCAGKTGTTDDCKYAWFAGYSKDILCVVYLGFDDPKRSLGVKMTGSKVALPVWMQFMKRAYEEYPDLFGEIEVPSGIVFYDTCRESGSMATPECPSTERLPFQIDALPPEDCPIHGLDALKPYQKEAYRIILSNIQY